MGITLKGYKCGADLTYYGFDIMRYHIASLYDQDVADTYWEFFVSYPNADLGEYERNMQKLEVEGKNMYGQLASKQLFDFMFQSDAGGHASYGFCKNVCKRILEYKGTVEVDNFLKTNYGYDMHPVTGNDIVKIFQSCVEHKHPLEWY